MAHTKEEKVRESMGWTVTIHRDTALVVTFATPTLIPIDTCSSQVQPFLI